MEPNKFSKLQSKLGICINEFTTYPETGATLLEVVSVGLKLGENNEYDESASETGGSGMTTGTNNGTLIDSSKTWELTGVDSNNDGKRAATDARGRPTGTLGYSTDTNGTGGDENWLLFDEVLDEGLLVELSDGKTSW